MLFGEDMLFESPDIELPICGWLVVIMEPEPIFPVCDVSSACTMSGSVKATMANDSLSLLIFFIWIFGFGLLFVSGKSFSGL